ncbi:hypothetical protein EVAR_88002_1 [Eumeta japonica]|uniref:Uncharacterized protein n=1 Tax=Eumeta variegata TaxID=151549 RepID=A0A4C1VDQ4_EUMVA|nr:hypothetical protein EVAR_88002_1 [Eumeta japonica]
MKRLMDVDEAREIRKGRTVRTSVVSAYPSGEIGDSNQQWTVSSPLIDALADFVVNVAGYVTFEEGGWKEGVSTNVHMVLAELMKLGGKIARSNTADDPYNRQIGNFPRRSRRRVTCMPPRTLGRWGQRPRTLECGALS